MGEWVGTAVFLGSQDKTHKFPWYYMKFAERLNIFSVNKRICLINFTVAAECFKCAQSEGNERHARWLMDNIIPDHKKFSFLKFNLRGKWTLWRVDHLLRYSWTHYIKATRVPKDRWADSSARLKLIYGSFSAESSAMTQVKIASPSSVKSHLPLSPPADTVLTSCLQLYWVGKVRQKWQNRLHIVRPSLQTGYLVKGWLKLELTARMADNRSLKIADVL